MLKRKKKHEQDSNSFPNSKIETNSSTLVEERNKKLRKEEQTVCDDFINKFGQSSPAEDNKVINVFRSHASNKFNIKTLQNLCEFENSGWCRNLLNVIILPVCFNFLC